MDFLSAIKIVPNPSGLITVNETLFIQLFSFLLFVFIINRIMFRPLRSAMNEREQYIDDINKDIDNADMELKTVSKMIKDGETKIKEEAQGLKEQLESAGKQLAAEQIEAGREEIAKLKEAAELQIQKQIEDARKQIQTEFEVLSVSIIEKILDRRLAS